MAASITFAGNRKQQEMFQVVKSSLAYQFEANQIFMGGSIRGGKTFSIACMQIFIAMEYPNSIHYVIRASQPNLTSSTIPSFEAVINIILENPKFRNSWKWHRQSGNYYVQYRNGSRIYFRSQNFDNDKDSDWLKGLEVNTIFLEQMEEIQESFYKVAISRVGSKRLKKEPRGLLFGSFNPTQNFVKKLIYEPYINGNLPPQIHFIETRPSDNPYNTEDQKRNWENMDARTYQQFINGSWEDYDMIDGKWLYTFTTEKRRQIVCDSNEIKLNPLFPVIVSFDFNNEPNTALIAQLNTSCSSTSPDHFIKIVDCIQLGGKEAGRLAITKLCQIVNQKYKGFDKIVTGDAAGNQSDSSRDANFATNWKIVLGTLERVTKTVIPKVNIRYENSRPQCNLIFEKHKNFKISDKLTLLIKELDTAKIDPKKPSHYLKDRNVYKMDCFDCLRYIFANLMPEYLNILHKS